MEKNVFIQYVTFARDVEWLRYSLESIRKFGTGFGGITIVVPTTDIKLFLQFERYSTDDCPVRIKNFLEYPGKGFVHHLAMKCYADVFCPLATHILHMDPDCLFHAPFSPDDYFKTVPAQRMMDGTLDPYDIDVPVLLIEPYEVLKTVHPARYNWKRVTEEALRFECTHETMCRHPAVHPRATYAGCRTHIEEVHETPFYDFVIKQQNKYPQGFGEFNTLGAYAMKFLPNEYFFIDRQDKGEGGVNDPVSKLTQMWSYTGTKKSMDQINKILK